MAMLGSQEGDARAAEGATSHRTQWRWHVLAFVPSGLMALVVVSVPIPYTLMADSSPSAAEDLVTIIYRVGISVAVGMPVYLYFLGRSYVRKVHGGLESPAPLRFYTARRT